MHKRKWDSVEAKRVEKKQHKNNTMEQEWLRATRLLEKQNNVKVKSDLFILHI